MKIRYCIECGKPLTKTSGAAYVCADNHYYYNNPRAAAAVVIFNENNEILVSKRAIEPRKGTYDLPGGFVEPNETVEDAVIREMSEETTLTIDKTHILASYALEYLENVYVCDLIVHASAWTGKPIAQDDSMALEWKPIDFLDSPEFTAPYPGLSTLLKEYIEQNHKV
jgi:NAD+ diphosphatase